MTLAATSAWSLRKWNSLPFLRWSSAAPAVGRCEKVHRRAGRQLAVAETGAGASQRAGYHDDQGAARPRHNRRAAWLRLAAVGGGGAYDGPHTAARWPLVHRRPLREARAGAYLRSYR